MSDLPLRAACIHGRYERHNTDERHIDSFLPCPGGRDITDSDILTLAADIIETDDAVGAVFDAAIGKDSGG